MLIILWDEKKIVEKILRYTSLAKKGKSQHYFITGKKGIGKTSLATYVQQLMKDDMVGVYISNKNNNSLETLTTNIIEKILNKLPKSVVKDKLKSIVGLIDGVEFKSTKINFNPKPEITKDLVNHFEDYLNKICKNIPENKGILLIIDDINGLSDSKDFVNWYKRLVDTITVDVDYNIPIYFLLDGYPEKFNNLVNYDESFSRIFHHDEIELLKDQEVQNFFIDTFKEVNMGCDSQALDLMVTYSSGLPLMMQEIGEAVFWETDTKKVSGIDANMGIIEAGKLIGKRQIKPVMDKSIRSENYENIFLKLGKFNIDYFKKNEFEKKLTSVEKRAFPKFLKRATDLNILESIGKDKSGEYKFSNRLYLVYFRILNLEKNNILS
ncbi:MAG: AAA family ATPase [Methanobacteriaceae archaeon]|nr:AAA family ATPase [Methanobacteriaceae archaeon]